MRYSDRPITRPDQDLLGRNVFALTLARSIDTMPVAEDGFVIAITGEWGTGKSSIIELVCRYLRHIEMERASNEPIWPQSAPSPKSIDELEGMALEYEKIENYIISVEEMNKDTSLWEKSDRRDEFKRRLGTDLAAEMADIYWKLKLRAEINGRTIIVRFSPWLIAGRGELASALLSELARSLGDRLGNDVKKAFGKILKRLAEFAPIAGAGIEMMSAGGVTGLLTASGNWTEKLANQMISGPTLDELRHQLRKILSGLSKKEFLLS